MTVSFTPGAFAFTEAGMVLLLRWLGRNTYTAGAVTLLFRLINYWSIVVLGFLLYVFVSQHEPTQQRKVRYTEHNYQNP